MVQSSSNSDDDETIHTGIVDNHKQVNNVHHSDDYDTDISSTASDGCWDNIDFLCDKHSASDSCSNSDTDSTEHDLKSLLQSWAVDCNVTHHQLNVLLPILKLFHPDLPLSAKTLLQTPQDIKTCSVSGGDYLYFGVEAGLSAILTDKVDFLSKNSEIELALNVDGLPLFVSSSYSLWPVLGYVMNVLPLEVFVIALYGGYSKPSDLKFLDEVVEELNRLIKTGINVGGVHLNCVLKMCVCDAPARSMVKCTKLYSGYYGCDKCEQRGSYEGRMTYPECVAALRTDDSFRSNHNSEHHQGVSPFCCLPVDMVKFFPIDYLHQICLGVVKRLLVCWSSGPKQVRLSHMHKMEVSKRLMELRCCVSKEFSRKPRSLAELAHWKATEFRSFLLYFGYFALRKIVRDDVFDHFMCLSVAINILVSEKLSVNTEYCEFAHNLLLHFVSKCAEIYGCQFLVYNVHSLVHITAEVEQFGKLDNSSAFVFENFMQKLKRSVRSTRNPVVQIGRRLTEHRLHGKPMIEITPNIDFSIGSYGCKAPNNYCILQDGQCCQIVGIYREEATCMIFSNPLSLFVTPCDSRVLGIHKVKLSNGVLKTLPIETIAFKALCIPDFEKGFQVFMMLLHSPLISK